MLDVSPYRHGTKAGWEMGCTCDGCRLMAFSCKPRTGRPPVNGPEDSDPYPPPFRLPASWLIAADYPEHVR